MSITTYKIDMNGEDLCIGIVQSRFNEDICQKMLAACLSELEILGVSEEDISLVTVPGALEIPLALQKLAETGTFDALIAIGTVIRGETYHFDIVSNESAAGITRVSLDHDVPIVNSILTTYTNDQAEARMIEKGTEAARVAVEMANLTLALDDLIDSEDDIEVF